MLKSRSQSRKEVPIVCLIMWPILVCLSILSWKLLGCPGIPDCYLCKSFSPDVIINPLAVSPSADDFTQLLDLKNFSFLMNNYACNDTELLLLVLVHSGPHNYERRLTIRSTWGNIFSSQFRVLFLVGIPNSIVTQRRLEEENDANGDLIQGNFADTYRNLTYKHVMALKWMKYFCPKAKYLLKADDDVFINSPRFLQYVSQNVPKTKLMRCWPVLNGFAQRSWRSKWRVMWPEYKFRFYPSFCQGFAVLYSPDVVLTLYEKAQTANYFWIDDVFVTGFLALSANFTPSTFGEHMLLHKDFFKLIAKGQNSKEFSYLLGPWNLDVEYMRILWDMRTAAQAGSSQGAES